MRTLEESRKYEVKMPDGSWQLVHWEQLDVDDIVRSNPPLSTDIYHLPDPFKVSEQPYLFTGERVVEHPHLIVDYVDERTAFEVWAKSECYEIASYDEHANIYSPRLTQCAWYAWQARAKRK